MRIERIETILLEVTAKGNWLLVQVYTDEGITGLGEASHSTNDPAAMRLLQEWEQKLLGRNPFEIKPIWEELNSPFFGRVEQTALSGLEQALWDIKGQALGVPIYELLGGALRKNIFLYANINRHVNDRSPQGFAKAAKLAASQGFKAVKIAPFDELVDWNRPMSGENALWRKGVERVAAVHEAIGPDVELAVDCHNRFEPAEAIRCAEALSDYELFWFEEPVSDAYPEHLARVCSSVSMPTAAGENAFGVKGFRHLLIDRVVDVVMPDVKQAGGICKLMEVGIAAKLSHVLLSPHCPSGPVSALANAQVSACATNFYRQEYAWGEVDWRADLLDPPELIKDSHLLLNDRPGLGHKLNPKVVEQHRLS